MRCIVAGNAQCLPDDLAKATEVYGELPVIAVNGASKEVKAFALFTQHPERFVKLGWMSAQKAKFGAGFTTHSTNYAHDHPVYVDEWWDIKRTGGSAWGARKLAFELGYDEVVLCGCPMEVMPYVGGHNLYGLMHKPDVVDDLFLQIEKDTNWHEGCISMSGRTRDLLGDHGSMRTE